MSGWHLYAAQCSAVRPCPPRSSAAAPFSSRCFTLSASPCRAARTSRPDMCRGAQQLLPKSCRPAGQAGAGRGGCSGRRRRAPCLLTASAWVPS